VPADELWRRIEARNSKPPWDSAPIRRDHLDEWAARFQAPGAGELALFDPPSALSPSRLRPRRGLCGNVPAGAKIVPRPHSASATHANGPHATRDVTGVRAGNGVTVGPGHVPTVRTGAR